MKQAEKYIPLILRVGVAFLWIWMAIVPKFIFPKPRIMMVSKSWIMPYFPFSAEAFVYGLGILELILGILLLIGLFTRTVSALQVVLTLAFIVGLFNVAAAMQGGITSPLAHLFLKDVPLIAANIVLIITGGGAYSIDNLRKK